MKKLILILICIASNSLIHAQQSYTVNDETLELKTEVEGSIDLLWNTFNGNYRYFVKTTDNSIIELKNTKGNDGKFQNEYQTTLNDITKTDASKVKLTTFSLKQFIDNYNAKTDSAYIIQDSRSKIKLRLGIFAGLTNNPFIENPNNETVPLFGSELEVVSDDYTSRHAGFLSIKYGTESDAFNYSSTQFALGYRYRFINKEKFNLYAQTKFASYTLSNSTVIVITSAEGEPITTSTEDVSGSAFDTPLIFGLGADVKVGNGYLSLVYDSIISVFLDNEGNFPVDFAIGYKFNL